MQNDKSTQQKRYSVMAPKLIAALNRRNYEAFFCETKEQAVEQALALTPDGSSVSWGGSATLDQIGLKERLHGGPYEVLDRDRTPDEAAWMEMMRKALTCDVFFSSVNALAEDGTMVNIDGTGNRVAAIAFGPKRVILIVGMNKICRDPAAARTRARTVAAPINGIRFNLNIPCSKTGVCGDCMSPESMCSYIVEMRRSRVDDRIKVILVGEDLGY